LCFTDVGDIKSLAALNAPVFGFRYPNWRNQCEFIHIRNLIMKKIINIRGCECDVMRNLIYLSGAVDGDFSTKVEGTIDNSVYVEADLFNLFE
jgi:hypothetical protein